MNPIYPPERCGCGAPDCRACFPLPDENDPEVIAAHEEEVEAWRAEITRRKQTGVTGSYTAYEPQWLSGKTWCAVPTALEHNGVPQPLAHYGINTELGLYGYEQAHALAWAYAALAAAEGRHIEVRVREFEVVYDLKAREIEDAP